MLTKAVSTIKLKCKVFSSAIYPKTTGPSMNPIFVVAATNETASAVFIPSTFDANLYTSGTTTEKPNPTTKKPKIETSGL